MTKIERQRPKEQDKNIRRSNFEAVENNLLPDQARLEASRCLNCKNPRCVQGCPVNINIPGFIQKVKEGDIEGAGEIIRQTSMAAGAEELHHAAREVFEIARESSAFGEAHVAALLRKFAQYGRAHLCGRGKRPGRQKRVILRIKKKERNSHPRQILLRGAFLPVVHGRFEAVNRSRVDVIEIIQSSAASDDLNVKEIRVETRFFLKLELQGLQEHVRIERVDALADALAPGNQVNRGADRHGALNETDGILSKVSQAF